MLVPDSSTLDKQCSLNLCYHSVLTRRRLGCLGNECTGRRYPQGSPRMDCSVPSPCKGHPRRAGQVPWWEDPHNGIQGLLGPRRSLLSDSLGLVGPPDRNNPKEYDICGMGYKGREPQSTSPPSFLGWSVWARSGSEDPGRTRMYNLAENGTPCTSRGLEALS